VNGVPETRGDSGNKALVAACETCGGHEVVELAGRYLCADCISVAGSACAGPGDNELTE
jgi:hypothetical protein